MLAFRRRLVPFTAEDRVVEAECVRAGQERAKETGDVERPAERPARCESRGDDAVLRPEAGEGGNADEREGADEERDVGSWEDALEPAHPPDVLLPVEVVDHDAGRHEEQRLEEGVRHQVEHRVPVCPDSGGEEHVADLGHRRVRDHALDVPLHERDESRQEEGEGAQDRREVLDVDRGLEDRMRAHEQVDACRDHRRGVDQRGDGSGALHRIGKPGVQRELGRLRDRAPE